ncbi:MAG TPA: hypothetical protein VK528_14265, partial [Flavobacterium sp.]|nr:hypothetical protein [Flavobacterium sp.]
MKKIIQVIALFSYGLLVSQNFNYERSWATYYGGQDTKVLDNAIDSGGNVYIVGIMEGNPEYLNNFSTDSAYQPTFGGGLSDGYLAKFNSGGLLVWATFFGGLNADAINTISIDAQDHIYIAGKTTSDNMATVGAYREFRTGMEDAFLAEFTTAGQRLWCTYYGDIYNDSFSAIECDNEGNLYLFGKTSSQQNITTTGSFQQNFVPNINNIDIPENDYKDFFVKFTNTGNRLWASYYGTNTSGGHRSYVTGISLNATGLYLVGYVIDTSLNTYFGTPGCYQATNSNVPGIGVDMFLSKFSFDGGR